MTTTVPETMTRQAIVAEASQEEGRNGVVQWAMKLEIKDISQFPVPCFMSIEQAPSVLKGSTHMVTMRRGKLKRDKSGQWPSDYFWNLVGWDVQAAPPQPPPAQAPRATERPQEAAPPAPVPWDAADTQSRISWAQAVNLAVEALAERMDYGWEEEESHYFRSVESLANRFYPLIRKGPTLPDPANPTEEDLGYGRDEPEPLFPDAPQAHQEPRNDGPAAVGSAQAMLPPFPIRGGREAPVNYFLRVAKERYGLTTQKEALAVIGGTWSGWVDGKGGQGGQGEEALQRALDLLKERKP